VVRFCDVILYSGSPANVELHGSPLAIKLFCGLGSGLAMASDWKSAKTPINDATEECMSFARCIGESVETSYQNFVSAWDGGLFLVYAAG